MNHYEPFGEDFLQRFPAFRGDLSDSDLATGLQLYSAWKAAKESAAMNNAPISKSTMKRLVTQIFEFGDDKWFDYEDEFMRLAHVICAQQSQDGEPPELAAENARLREKIRVLQNTLTKEFRASQQRIAEANIIAAMEAKQRKQAVEQLREFRNVFGEPK